MLFIASFLFTFQVCTTRFNNKNEVFWIFVCLVEDGALKRALSFQQPGRGLTPPPSPAPGQGVEAATPPSPLPRGLLGAVGHGGLTAGRAVLSRGAGLGAVVKGTPPDGRLLGRNETRGVPRVMAPPPPGPGVWAPTEGGAGGARDLVSTHENPS